MKLHKESLHLIVLPNLGAQKDNLEATKSFCEVETSQEGTRRIADTTANGVNI